VRRQSAMAVVALLAASLIGIPAGVAAEESTTSSPPANSTPVIVSLAPLTMVVGVESPVVVSFTHEDGGPVAVTVDWGDGSAPSLLPSATAGTVTFTHTYAARGRFTATVTVDDLVGGIAVGTFQVSVVGTCGGAVATIDAVTLGLPAGSIVGTEGPDVILGTDGNDVISGLGGDYNICGGPGNDTIYGGDGNDTIYGESGDDVIDGGTGSNYVDGGDGIDDCGPAGGVNCEYPSLAAGATGSEVARLQTLLTQALLYRGPINGKFDTATQFAAMTFHKAVRLTRTYQWNYADWALLARYLPDVPARAGNPDRVEVDIKRQILTVVKGGTIRAVIPVSTGGGYTYYSRNAGGWVQAGTPRGHFHLSAHANGYQCSYMGCIYRPWYFTPHYAIHGYPKVPEYPASHGCVRVPNWEADWLDGQLARGMAMYIWDAPPGGQPVVPTPPDVTVQLGVPSAVQSTPGSRTVKVSWQAPASDGGQITDYAIQYRRKGYSTWTLFRDNVSTDTHSHVSGLTNGVVYQFRVAGKNSAGTGPWSATSEMRVGVPTQPQSVVPTAGSGDVQLSWQAPASNGGAQITDYVIQYRSEGNTTWVTFPDGRSANRHTHVTSLTDGVRYQFRIAARNSRGVGVYSAVIEAVAGSSG
jgi:lipoprotein-anchoring transpeptidase ErfK/SrfK